jgi:hypothetical protein
MHLFFNSVQRVHNRLHRNQGRRLGMNAAAGIRSAFPQRRGDAVLGVGGRALATEDVEKPKKAHEY